MDFNGNIFVKLKNNSLCCNNIIYLIDQFNMFLGIDILICCNIIIISKVLWRFILNKNKYHPVCTVNDRMTSKIKILLNVGHEPIK